MHRACSLHAHTHIRLRAWVWAVKVGAGVWVQVRVEMFKLPLLVCTGLGDRVTAEALSLKRSPEARSTNKTYITF